MGVPSLLLVGSWHHACSVRQDATLVEHLEAFGPVCTAFALITAIGLPLALSLTMLCSMTDSNVG